MESTGGSNSAYKITINSTVFQKTNCSGGYSGFYVSVIKSSLEVKFYYIGGNADAEN